MSSTLKIASWNINSVRARLDIVEKFLREESPDILCLQETKVCDADFPAAMFRRLGYIHQIICGQRMHHGVAILSRLAAREEERHDWQANGEARHIGVRLECGIRLENVYIPAGGDTPDREVNPKFGQKLDFIERMTRWSEACRCPTIVVGDFNVAPLECDVWNHKQLLTVVSHTPIEVEALTRLQASNDWVDLGRHFHPAPQRLHTWWSYRSPDWTKNDRGRRLDHMWATRDVARQAVRHASTSRAATGPGRRTTSRSSRNSRFERRARRRPGDRRASTRLAGADRRHRLPRRRDRRRGRPRRFRFGRAGGSADLGPSRRHPQAREPARRRSDRSGQDRADGPVARPGHRRRRSRPRPFQPPQGAVPHPRARLRPGRGSGDPAGAPGRPAAGPVPRRRRRRRLRRPRRRRHRGVRRRPRRFESPPGRSFRPVSPSRPRSSPSAPTTTARSMSR